MARITRKALVVIVWREKPAASEAKVLLLRLNPDRGGFWQSVTGKVEEGESFGAGALREAEEETGLRFDREPQYLGIEHRFPSRWGGEAWEKAFYLPIFGGSEPPAPTLDGKEHDGFEWLAQEEAGARVKFPTNRLAIERATTGASPLLLSARGSFYQDGEEVTHERTAELLHRSLERKPSGLFTVRIAGEELDVIVEDNPLLVKSYDRASGEMTFSNGAREKLRPETLQIREDNAFVCEALNGWPATFLPSAYFEITKDVREESGKYVLHFFGRDYELAIPH